MSTEEISYKNHTIKLEFQSGLYEVYSPLGLLLGSHEDQYEAMQWVDKHPAHSAFCLCNKCMDQSFALC